MKPFPTRDVHLDFHTSGLIPDVGADFDPAEFAATLKAAHVNTIALFARCHHGYCYYPTQVGTPHPHLTRPDLLGEMIDAVRRVGISPAVYTTVVWDELTAQNHPEWRQVTPEGRFIGGEQPGWKYLCMNTPYADWLEAHFRELLERYEFDRFFVDIVFQWQDGCACDWCRAGMKQDGLDIRNATDRRIYAQRVRSRFVERMERLVREIQPGVRPFFNRGWALTAAPEARPTRDLDRYGYMVIESLPSGFWGYNHFPLLASYFEHRCEEIGAMTGRFHRMWGDFGGLKNQAALEYECMRMLAWGVKCSVGDQLHPSGRLEPATYRLIGSVYSQVEALEPWTNDTKAAAEIGVLLACGTGPEGINDDDSRSEEGAMRVLMELGYQFQLLDETDDFSAFGVLILPDRVYLSKTLHAKLEAFLAAGGKILATGVSGQERPDGGFVLPNWPARWLGDGEFTTHYLRPLPEAGADLETYDYAVYERGARVAASEGATVLAQSVEPYFERAPQHFCSHAQTPPTGTPDQPAGMENGAIVYFADPLFRAYRAHGHRVYKLLLRNALTRLLPEPLLRHNLPSTAEITVRRQGERSIVHVLHYVAQRRAEQMDIVEEVIPLHAVRVGLRMEKEPKRAYLAPGEEALAVQYEDGYAWVEIPRVDGHAHVVFEH